MTRAEATDYQTYLLHRMYGATAGTVFAIINELTGHASEAFFGATWSSATWTGSPAPEAGGWCWHGPPDLWDMDRAPTSGYYLYRLWGDADRLLYIGVSRGLRARFKAHRRRWGDVIRRATWEQHPDAGAMIAAEAAAIAAELPPLNMVGVG